MNETRAIFICGNPIAIPVLRYLLFNNQLAVLVMPKQRKAFVEEVQQLLMGSNIPVVLVTATDFASSVQEAIQQYQPVIGLVFGCSYKIPAAVFNMPAKGFYNIHPGPLPAYRGPDPVFRQIKNREPFAAVTIHQLDEGMDTGPVVLINKIQLPVTGTYGMVLAMLGELAVQMISTLLKMAAFGIKIPSRAQDHSLAVFYPRQSAADITVNWQTMDAATIVALINACNPWNKGAVASINQNIIRLLEAEVVEEESVENFLPGTITACDANGLKVATINGMLLVHIIYCNEGFLTAARLLTLGVVPGTMFAALPV